MVKKKHINTVCCTDLLKEKEDSKSFNQLETRIAHRNHVFCQSKTKWYQFVDDLIYTYTLYLLTNNLDLRFQRRYFKFQPVRNKIWQWQQIIFPDQDKMRTICKGPHKQYLFQLIKHLNLQFQRRRFLKFQPIKKKELSIATNVFVAYLSS